MLNPNPGLWIKEQNKMNDLASLHSITLLIVGATGAVGQQVLRLAQDDTRVQHIFAPSRHALPPHPKLKNPIIDFEHLDKAADYWQVDAVICTLGTTMRIAGSKAGFVAIDRDLPIAIAAQAQAGGATCFVLNSSLGAKIGANFYLNTKAEVEQGIRELGFARYTIVRPSLIDAERADPRLGEKIGIFFARLLKPLMPKRYRAVAATAIAHALLEAALAAQPGEHLIESEALQD